MRKLIGRQIVVPKEKISEYSEETFAFRPSIDLSKDFFCQRCGSVVDKSENGLPNGAFFCSSCQSFGKLTSDSFLVTVRNNQKDQESRFVAFTWRGKLTDNQARIAQNLVSNYQKGQSTLLWAVTGSGKTEMIFPIIHKVLSQSGRVCVTSPRIDVCRELYPRITEAFKEEEGLLLYGGSKENYRYSELTICTTHQMLHFYQAFDLIIVDEIDAFPYEGNQMLQYGLNNALKKQGKLIYLTATPPNHLLKVVQTEFAIEKSPIRFHQRPLIVPECIWFNHWEKVGHRSFYFQKLYRMIEELLKDNNVLVFCPSISFMECLAKKAKGHFKFGEVESVSSVDRFREEKVQKMRDQSYRVLFTTTILERGVTFENVSVIVLGANHPVYTKSALVQIAGRVDRKGAFRRGRVLFLYNQKTKSMRQACHEIQMMNQLAREWLVL